MAEGHIQVVVFLPAVGAIIIYAAKLVYTIRAFIEFSSFFLCHFSGSVIFFRKARQVNYFQKQ
jgi:hypothetical protein